jgi:hypothetical protein
VRRGGRVRPRVHDWVHAGEGSTVVHGNGAAHEAGVAALGHHRQLAVIAVFENARDLFSRAWLQAQPGGD